MEKGPGRKDGGCGKAAARLLFRTAVRALLITCLFAPLAAAQTGPGRRPGLLGEIRSRFSFRSPEEIWDEAQRTPSVPEAQAMMESLLGRRESPDLAARAALWLGHLYYGSGDVSGALGYFVQAREKAEGGRVRVEAGFWTAQCRNLLGTGQEEPGAPRRGQVDEVLGAMAAHDGELRLGRFDDALRGYLGLEGEARQAGCLAPLLYRVGLIAASGTERGGAAPVDWDLVRRWEPAVPASPERALVEALAGAARAAPARSPEAAAPPESTAAGVPEGSAPESPATTEPESSATPASSRSVTPESAPAPSEGGAESGTGPAENAGGAGHDRFAVQVGAFQDRDRAERETARLSALGVPVRLDTEVQDGATWYKIRVGDVATRGEADEIGRNLDHDLSWRVVRISR